MKMNPLQSKQCETCREGVQVKYKILPLFIPHRGCPHKCIFCDQKTITGLHAQLSVEEIYNQIQSFISIQQGSSQQGSSLRLFRKEVAFYGGSFTALPHPLQRRLLKPACQALIQGWIDGIRLSTRPDYCDSDALSLLKEHHIGTVELGIQSMDENVLLKAERGHGVEDSVNSLKRLRSEGFIVGAQLMPGLPGEDDNSFFSTVNKIISLAPDFVRLYPTLVIRGTRLEYLYQQGGYIPLSLEKAIELCSDAAFLFRNAGIRVIRCGIQPTPSLQREGAIVSGPFHPAFGELVDSSMIFKRVNKAIETQYIQNIQKNKKQTLTITSSPRYFSLLKGHRGGNQDRIKGLYPEIEISFKPDLSLPHHIIRIVDNFGRIRDIINPLC